MIDLGKCKGWTQEEKIVYTFIKALELMFPALVSYSISYLEEEKK